MSVYPLLLLFNGCFSTWIWASWFTIRSYWSTCFQNRTSLWSGCSTCCPFINIKTLKETQGINHNQWPGIPDMLSTLSPDRPPAVLQSPILFKRDGSASLSIWHVLTLSRITIRLLRRRWGGSTLMCSQLTLGSTQLGEKPLTVHSGNASSTWQHSIKEHTTEERVTWPHRDFW